MRKVKYTERIQTGESSSLYFEVFLDRSQTACIEMKQVYRDSNGITQVSTIQIPKGYEQTAYKSWENIFQHFKQAELQSRIEAEHHEQALIQWKPKQAS